MTEQEPTTWELKRSLDELRQMLRDGFAAWNARSDRFVGNDLFNAHIAADQQAFLRIESALSAEDSERRSDVKAIRDDIRALVEQREGFQRQIILVGITAVLSLIGTIAVNLIGRL